MTAKKLIPHPAKTKAQRRVLDEIGAGNFSPIAHPRVLQALLDQELIKQGGDKFFLDPPARFNTYYMEYHIHIRWCQYWAQFSDEELEAIDHD